MPINVEEIIAKLSPARRKKVEDRAAQLITEEMTLRQLRKARKLTQVRMAKVLRISQDGVSRLEKRTDLLLSTLRKSVQAMGGNLTLVAEFPDRPPVVLSRLGGDETALRHSARRRAQNSSNYSIDRALRAKAPFEANPSRHTFRPRGS